MFLISAISNHNISYVSAKPGHYTFKTAFFSWKTMHYLFKLSTRGITKIYEGQESPIKEECSDHLSFQVKEIKETKGS